LKKVGLFPVIIIAFILILTGCSQSKSVNGTAEGKNTTVTIGYQQSLSPVLLAKEKGWFEKEFKKKGVNVKWAEFQSGPPQFEAMSSGRIDFAQVGNAPVIVGQAANIPFKEIALSSEGTKGNAILVQKNSKIKSLKDLKGKKIAVAKGSSGFNLLYVALNKAGIKPNDVQIIQLQPDEAQPAFESGKVDAWSIWEPFVSLQVIKKGARVLADGTTLDLTSPGFTIVRSAFAKEHPELVVDFLKIYQKALTWQKKHPEQAIDFYAKAKGIDKDVVRRVLVNNEMLNKVTTKKIINEQQKTADFLYKQGTIKQKIDTSKVVDNSYIKKALKGSD